MIIKRAFVPVLPFYLVVYTSDVAADDGLDSLRRLASQSAAQTGFHERLVVVIRPGHFIMKKVFMRNKLLWANSTITPIACASVTRLPESVRVRIIFWDYMLPLVAGVWMTLIGVGYTSLKGGDLSSLLGLLLLILIPGLLYIAALSSFWRELKSAFDIIRKAFPNVPSSMLKEGH